MTTQIDYHFSLTPYDVNDGVTIPYFKAHNFNTAQLIVPDTGIYSYEINKIKSLGIPNVIVDIEQPIWTGGAQQGTPISNFASYLAQLKSVGVTKVASEGGRPGDLDFIAKYFPKGYMNYNCDQCGLWKDFYKHPTTFANSWESYYTWQWPAIQKGVQESAPLGIKNGILAGVWGGSENPILADTKAGSSNVTYFSEADWINTHGGLDHFAVWGGLNPYMLGRYKDLEFEAIVAKMQSVYPPRGTQPTQPKIETKALLTVSNPDPMFNEQVKFIATISDKTNKPLAKPIQIWHTLCEPAKGNVRYNDVTGQTDITGHAVFNQTFKAGHAERGYYVTFEGDSTHKESTSPKLAVYVHRK
jgi:hypothetical protein